MGPNIPEAIERMEALAGGQQYELSHECRIALEDACQYARENSLTRDYEIDPLLDINDVIVDFMSISPEAFVDGKLPFLPGFEIPPAIQLGDIWDMSEQSAKLINAACRRLGPEELARLERQALGFGAHKNLKVELPLVTGDPSRDLRDLRHNINATLHAPLGSHRFPLEPVDAERDEGLEFPSSYQRFAQDMITSIKEETFEVSRDVLVSISEHLRDDWTDEKQRRFLDRETSFKKNLGAERITPPLSPMRQEDIYFVPEGDVCLVPIPSDSSSTLSAEIREVETAMFDKHDNANIFDPDTLITSPSELCSDDLSSLQLLTNTLPERSKSEDLRVEVPLRPEFDHDDADPTGIFDPTGAVDSIAEHHTLQDITEQMKRDLIEDDIDRAFETILRDTATNVKRKLEQEKLDPIDAIPRVRIPLADFSIEEPAWMGIGNDSLAMFKFLCSSDSRAFKLPKWPGDKSSELNMVWKPVKDVEPTETLDEAPQSSIDRFLETRSGSELSTSADYVWKREGLAILRDDRYDDDEEISPIFSTTKPKRDLVALVQAKKRTLEERACDEALPATGYGSKFEGQIREGATSNNPGMLLDDGLPIAGRLLDNYLHLHAPKRLKQARRDRPDTARPLIEHCLQGTATGQGTKAAPARAPDKGMSVYTPPLQLPDQLPRVIVSLSLPRTIIRQLEKLLPSIEMLDRDYDAHNSSQWIPGSICRSEISSPLAAEADVSISSVTGVLLTTMVKIRQKPVPGANGQSVIRNRIERVAARYERLIVLVSENSKDESMSGMSSADTTTFAEFQGYLTTLDTSVISYYVGGGEKALAVWVAWCICNHGAEGLQTGHCIREIETFWEVFLRRAGLNVYASQAVLAALRDSSQEGNEGGSGRYGLTAFVNMMHVERCERFESMLGGAKVLENVSNALDSKWQ